MLFTVPPLLAFDFFHWLAAANKLSAADFGNVNLIAADVTFIMLADFLYCHRKPPFLSYKLNQGHKNKAQNKGNESQICPFGILLFVQFRK